MYLGDPAPGGGEYGNDFEPGGINSNGDLSFGADVTTGGEGIFVWHRGKTTELARTGGTSPDGGTYEFGFLGPVGMNDKGDTVYDFLLAPFAFPFGFNAGAYRYSPSTGAVDPVVSPFVTPAPGGGTFQGVTFYPTINNRGDTVFAGMIETDDGVHAPGEEYNGLGLGIFRANARGRIASVVSPGDAAPGGGTFDYAGEAWSNDLGDVSFTGHRPGEEIFIEGFPPQEIIISAFASLYVKSGATGKIKSIAHTGDPAPGGGVFRQAFHSVINNNGDIAFIGDLTPAPANNEIQGAFAYIAGHNVPVALPGDPMPGGGTLISASNIGGNIHINDRREVVFSASVDGGGEHPGVTGLYMWSKGQLHLVARTGTVIPGVGTVAQLSFAQLVIPPPPVVTASSGALNNNAGQVLFGATMVGGDGVLLVATPR